MSALEAMFSLVVLFSQLSAIFAIGAIVADYIIDPIVRKK